MLQKDRKLGLRELAEKHRDTAARYGVDLDLDRYPVDNRVIQGVSSLEELDEESRESMERVGMDLGENEASGSYVQIDGSAVYSEAFGDVEILPMSEAKDRYGLENYLWQAVDIQDKYSARVELEPSQGYFIRVPEGVKEVVPAQTCLLMQKESQNVHNVVVLEEDAELHVLTGCTKTSSLDRGLHTGVTEFFLGKNSKLTYTMIHSWGENIHVRPRTGAILEEDAVFINNYVVTTPVASLQSYPAAYCKGKNSKASFQTMVYGKNGSSIDTGSRSVLEGRGSSCEMVSRTISEDDSRAIIRGHLKGEKEDVKGHLECKGLILSDDSFLKAIPVLEASRENLDLTHEAAVGRIQDEQLHYLMSRGLTEEEATSLIIKGFLSLDIKGLPEKLQETVDEMMELTLEEAM